MFDLAFNHVVHVGSLKSIQVNGFESYVDSYIWSEIQSQFPYRGGNPVIIDLSSTVWHFVFDGSHFE